MKIYNISLKIFLIMVGLAFTDIALKALTDPQIVMDYVNLEIGNNITARNSLRAIYGGVSIAFGMFCIYGAFRMAEAALVLVMIYCGGFVFGRLMSIYIDGVPGSFAMQWLYTEALLGLISAVLLVLQTRVQRSKLYPQT